MISPQPSRLRMKRRKTVSVTPAMGASTVAGEIRTSPIKRLAGTGFGGAGWRTGVSAPHEPELSQNFFTLLFYFPRQAARPHGASDALVRRAALIRTAVEELPPRTRRPGLHEVHKTKPSPQRGLEALAEIRLNSSTVQWPESPGPWRTCGGSAPRGRRCPSASACR